MWRTGLPGVARAAAQARARALAVRILARARDARRNAQMERARVAQLELTGPRGALAEVAAATWHR
eukprot:5527203-Lingulodinium_polyedra.AAC.1